MKMMWVVTSERKRSSSTERKLRVTSQPRFFLLVVLASLPTFYLHGCFYIFFLFNVHVSVVVGTNLEVVSGFKEQIPSAPDPVFFLPLRRESHCRSTKKSSEFIRS